MSAIDLPRLTTVIYDWMPDGADVSLGADGTHRHMTGVDLARYIFDRASEYGTEPLLTDALLMAACGCAIDDTAYRHVCAVCGHPTHAEPCTATATTEAVCTACGSPRGSEYHRKHGRRWDVPFHPFYPSPAAPTPADTAGGPSGRR